MSLLNLLQTVLTSLNSAFHLNDNRDPISWKSEEKLGDFREMQKRNKKNCVLSLSLLLQYLSFSFTLYYIYIFHTWLR